jgi:hypothetical protein
MLAFILPEVVSLREDYEINKKPLEDRRAW